MANGRCPSNEQAVRKAAERHARGLVGYGRRGPGYGDGQRCAAGTFGALPGYTVGHDPRHQRLSGRLTHRSASFRARCGQIWPQTHLHWRNCAVLRRERAVRARPLPAASGRGARVAGARRGRGHGARRSFIARGPRERPARLRHRLERAHRSAELGGGADDRGHDPLCCFVAMVVSRELAARRGSLARCSRSAKVPGHGRRYRHAGHPPPRSDRDPGRCCRQGCGDTQCSP